MFRPGLIFVPLLFSQYYVCEVLALNHCIFVEPGEVSGASCGNRRMLSLGIWKIFPWFLNPL